jgi:hypothetical protein
MTAKSILLCLTFCTSLLLLAGCNATAEHVTKEINKTRKKIEENNKPVDFTRAERLSKESDQNNGSYKFHEKDSLTEEELHTFD